MQHRKWLLINGSLESWVKMFRVNFNLSKTLLRYCIWPLVVVIIFILPAVITFLWPNLVYNSEQNSIGAGTASSLDEPALRQSYGDLNKFNVINGDLRITPCNTIHLAIVCGGFNSTRSFYVMLKSILFSRTDLIHLHLFVDNISRTILDQLFQTWLVPDLLVDYYNISQYEHEISWISSQHYSHRYGLMKLVFLSVLHDTHRLSKVILMDTDMLALGNINTIWNHATKIFEPSNGTTKFRPVFGMVENKSDWYLSNNKLSGGRSVWPAIGRGFNSGLIVVDLIELEKQNWRHLWREVAELELTYFLSTSLADQDILNAVIRLHSHMINELPCSFNIQLNDHTNIDKTCPIRSDFKLIHWNSPYKLETKNQKSEYFRNWYLTFRNWDGKLLRQSHCINQLSINASSELTSRDSNLDNICSEIRPRPEEKLRTYLYFLEFESNQTDVDVTFVVHLSLDRLQLLDQLTSHWAGPISAAIYLSELETDLLLVSIQNSNNLSRRRNIGYHLVFRDYGFNYPINRLRNIALENAVTPYVYLSDIDFLPSMNLYDYLKQTIASMVSHENSDPLAKRALVVPAFENLQYKFDFPTSKAELLMQLNLGSVSMFRDQIWPQGHAPTDYAKWRASTKPYKVDWKPEYEPFIVTSKVVPRFDERFVGFGWNKVENIVQLAALDYEFIVLPEAFAIHKFHSASYDILKHRESSRYRICIKQLRRTFLLELNMKYPNFFKSIGATQYTTKFTTTTTTETNI